MGSTQSKTDRLKDIIIELHQLEAIKFGEFQLKSGIMSPVYFDLRVMVSEPKLMAKISRIMWDTYADNKSGPKAQLICGVPYTASGPAYLISLDQNIPSIVKRKEKKEYGTKKMLEGKFEVGQNCLIIEDVISSGASVLETAEVLKNEKLEVTDVVVFLDREQGGSTNLKNQNVNVHSVTNVTTLLQILFEVGKITDKEKEKVENFIQNNKLTNGTGTNQDLPGSAPNSVQKMTIKDRMNSDKCNSSLAKQLFGIMDEKNTNLCLAADVKTSQELFDLAEKTGRFICCLKTHVDALSDWHEDSSNNAIKLKEIAKKFDFLIFEDRKFADIGKTVEAQFNREPYAISSWADLVTVHGLPGPGILDGLNHKENRCKALIVAEMSSKGNLATKEYAVKCVELAKNHKNAIGVISQSRLDDTKPDLIHMTPGVKIAGVKESASEDNLGQQYNTPEKAVIEKGADIIIVGRGITEAEDPEEKAKEYQERGWRALLQRCEKS